MTNETKTQNALTEPQDLWQCQNEECGMTALAADTFTPYTDQCGVCPQCGGDSLPLFHVVIQYYHTNTQRTEIKAEFHSRQELDEARDIIKTKTMPEWTWYVRPQNFDWILNGERVSWNDSRLRS